MYLFSLSLHQSFIFKLGFRKWSTSLCDPNSLFIVGYTFKFQFIRLKDIVIRRGADCVAGLFLL